MTCFLCSKGIFHGEEIPIRVDGEEKVICKECDDEEAWE